MEQWNRLPTFIHEQYFFMNNNVFLLKVPCQGSAQISWRSQREEWTICRKTRFKACGGLRGLPLSGSQQYSETSERKFWKCSQGGEQKTGVHLGEIIYQMCRERIDGSIQRWQCQAEIFHGFFETRMQGSKHWPTICLCGHDGCWSHSWQGPWSSSKFYASHTTSGNGRRSDISCIVVFEPRV